MVEIEVLPLKRLADKVKKLGDKISDLRPLFEQLSAVFYKSEKQIFQLRGPGRYKDLSDDYAIAKQRKFGFKYPILFATGELAASLLDRGNKGSVNIIERRFMAIGTSIDHAVYHHSKLPRSIIPRRPLWLEDKGNQMEVRFNRTVQAYFDKMLVGAFK